MWGPALCLWWSTQTTICSCSCRISIIKMSYAVGINRERLQIRNLPQKGFWKCAGWCSLECDVFCFYHFEVFAGGVLQPLVILPPPALSAFNLSHVQLYMCHLSIPIGALGSASPTSVCFCLASWGSIRQLPHRRQLNIIVSVSRLLCCVAAL